MADYDEHLTIRVDADLVTHIETLGAACGLSPSQMASAMLVLFHHQMVRSSLPATEPVEPEEEETSTEEQEIEAVATLQEMGFGWVTHIGWTRP